MLDSSPTCGRPALLHRSGNDQATARQNLGSMAGSLGKPPIRRRRLAFLSLIAALLAVSVLLRAPSAAKYLQNMSCMSLKALLANASEITVAMAEPSPRRSWFALQEAMHMPVFSGLHLRRSCALIGSHPRALEGMAKHRATIMRADTVVALNRANCTFIASILGRRPDIVSINAFCGKSCTVVCGGTLMISVVHHSGLNFLKSGYLYSRAAIMERMHKITDPSTGMSALIFLLPVCHTITLVGFSKANEAVQPSWYHASGGMVGVHQFGLEGLLRESMRNCLLDSSGRPRISILE
jgi:hypothetical protein